MQTTLRASSHALIHPILPSIRCLRPRAAANWQSLRPSIIRVQGNSLRALSQCSALRSVTADSPADLAETYESPIETSSRSDVDGIRSLPVVCSGCGAHSQVVDEDAPGFYDLTKPRNKTGGRQRTTKTARREEDAIFQRILDQGGLPESYTTSHTQSERSIEAVPSASKTPICDRCHDLTHQSLGKAIIHPSMRSIQDIIEESPHKHNHIYHVIDAADFPMSMIPNLVEALDLSRLRSKNRRSRHVQHVRGRVAEVSFIVTRSDLLAPKKEQVDSLMPYLQNVLRDTLSRTARNVRLGNVRCVSAKRGWWTKNLKEDIWNRGGAGWMVGKVNVGKSALFEGVFPKGRTQSTDQARRDDVTEQTFPLESPAAEGAQLDATNSWDKSHPGRDEFHQNYEEDSLLPPAQPETEYPTMPLVSSLPGTTASPIRIPFGSGKGELIDLPGIERSSLDTHVMPEHHKGMVMRSRVAPDSYTIKPGQSLILGGLIRITPRTNDEIVIAHPFVPPAFTPHVTATHKAIAIQTGFHSSLSPSSEGEAYTGTVGTIGTKDAKNAIKSAGAFLINWDATKRRTGPLTDPVAGKQKVSSLPFTVYSTDILIEGVGWVELSCQVRKRHAETLRAARVASTQSQTHDVPPSTPSTEIEATPSTENDEGIYKPFGSGESKPSDAHASTPTEASSTSPTRDAFRAVDPQSVKLSEKPDEIPRPVDFGPQFPEVEVFTPLGKYIGQRQPMNASLVGGGGASSRKPAHLRKGRPRQTIGMMKRRQPSHR